MTPSRCATSRHSKPLLTEATARPLRLDIKCEDCPGCGSCQAVVRLRNCPDRLLGVPGHWDVVSCEDCGFTYTSPRSETDLLQFIRPAITSTSMTRPIDSDGFAIVAAMTPCSIRFGVDWVVKPFGSRRFLDVGAAPAICSIALAATDGSARASTSVPQRNGRPPGRAGGDGRVATLTTFKSDQRFALISMQHVLEHLPDPQESLARCRALLEPAGILVISVPSISSFEARVFKQRWIGLDLPRHLTHFTPATLTTIVERTGFEVLRLRPAMFASSLSESLLLTLPGNSWFEAGTSRVNCLGISASVSYLSERASAQMMCRSGTENQSAPLVYVVVLNYNGRASAYCLFDSRDRLRKPLDPRIDNASLDGSADIAARAAWQPSGIRNLGWSGGATWHP